MRTRIPQQEEELMKLDQAMADLTAGNVVRPGELAQRLGVQAPADAGSGVASNRRTQESPGLSARPSLW